MEDIRAETVATYNKSASALADYFAGIGSRVKDIQLAFKLAGDPDQAKVLEIGCGDGRDAAEIIKRTDEYTGMDISNGMLAVARKKMPKTRFIQADIANFEFPHNLDIIFSFASLLHSDKDEVTQVLARAHKTLKPSGIFFISLKHMPEYMEQVKEDTFGRRLFYFYNPELITELAGKGYQSIFQDFQKLGNTNWFTVALKRL